MQPRKRAVPKLVSDDLRRKRNDYFYAYRRGKDEDQSSKKRKLASQRWNLKVYHGAVEEESFPHETNEGLLRYDDYFRKKDRADAWWAKRKKTEWEEQLRKKQERDQERELPGWKMSKVLAKDMYDKGAGLHFVKVLGAGGMGIISVFVSYDNNQTKTFWTVKRDKAGCHDVAVEKDTTSRFFRAPHIVQIFNPSIDVEEEEDEDDGGNDYLPPLRPSKQARTEPNQAQVRKETRATRRSQRIASIARKAGTAERQPTRRPQVGPTDQADGIPDTMIMEYIPRGSLHDWFKKLGRMKYEMEPDLVIPNRVLWDMMACFLKMCIAVEYHPLYVLKDDTGEYMIPETFPTAPPPGSSIVHFDIDPQNVMIGNYDWETTKGKAPPTHPKFEQMTDAHDRTPIFKLIDFGLARPMDINIPCRVDPNQNWSIRTVGKRGYFLPEQFTREWEHIVDSPDAQYASMAGQYSWKSNLWQFGMIMHLAITLRYHPAGAIHAVRDANLLTGPPSNLPDWKQTRKVYATYGLHLLDPQYNHVSIRLRHLVARCLCEAPIDRPGFEEIKAEIEWAWKNEDPADREAARQWCRGKFERPPPPKVPEWTKVEKWTKQDVIIPFDEYEMIDDMVENQLNN